MSDRLVTLGIYTDAIEANIAKNLLESNGIASCVADDQASAAFGWVIGFSGGVKLLVNEDDAPRAEVILSAIRDEKDLDEHDDPEPKSEEIATTRTCPTCGQSFSVEFPRCPRCAPSEQFYEDDPTRPRANLAPMGLEDEVEKPSPGDEMARRALWSAVLGLVICPVFMHFYAMVLILRVCLGDEELRPRSWTKVYFALVLCVAELAIVSLVWLLLLR